LKNATGRLKVTRNNCSGIYQLNPKRYIRHAREKYGENPKIEVMLLYKNLSDKFLSLEKNDDSKEYCLLLENAFDSVGPKLDCKLNAYTSATNEPSNEQENVDPNM
jgi:hypothetical protein